MRDEQFIESRAILHRWIAFIVFFVSGFAALLYQVIWQRLLVFFSGADVYAVTMIVTTFMAGRRHGYFVGWCCASPPSKQKPPGMFFLLALATFIFYPLLSRSVLSIFAPLTP